MMRLFLLIAGVGLIPATVLAQPLTSQEKCLLEASQSMPADSTLRQVREACGTLAEENNDKNHEKADTATYDPVFDEENEAKLSTYRMNYVLPLTYDQHRPSSAPFSHDVTVADDRAQKVEAKYQISFKFPLWHDVQGRGVYAAYTQRSFWQMYNTEASRPFRETNYEPEVWYQYPVNMDVWGWRLSSVHVGLNHQSNGRGQAYSRSWNRLMSTFEFQRGAYHAELRPWWRIKEDPNNDDNPDISHYMGNFDLIIGRDIGRHFLGVTLRNNLELTHNRGAVQFDWTFPLPWFRSKAMRGYVQWFNGYGESLIDYNVRQNSIGAGIQLLD